MMNLSMFFSTYSFWDIFTTAYVFTGTTLLKYIFESMVLFFRKRHHNEQVGEQLGSVLRTVNWACCYAPHYSTFMQTQTNVIGKIWLTLKSTFYKQISKKISKINTAELGKM